MSTFTHNGKTYDTDDRKSGMSKREYFSFITGGSKDDYEKSKESGDVSESFEETSDYTIIETKHEQVNEVSQPVSADTITLYEHVKVVDSVQ
jgi:hypothetical protein